MASVLGPAVGAHCAAHSKRCLAWAGRLAGAQLPRYQADFPRQAAAASPVSPCRITHCPMHAMRRTGGAALAAQRLRRTQPGRCSSIRAGTTSRSSSARRCSTTARACRRLLLWLCHACCRWSEAVCLSECRWLARASFLGAAARCARSLRRSGMCSGFRTLTSWSRRIDRICVSGTS